MLKREDQELQAAYEALLAENKLLQAKNQELDVANQDIQTERDYLLDQQKDNETLVALNQQLQAEISAHQQTETALRQSQRHYQAIVENRFDLSCRYEVGTLNLTFVNTAYCTVFEQPEEHLLGHSILHLIPEESHEEIHKHVKFLIENPEYYQYEHQVLDVDGSIVWQEWIAKAVLDETGRAIEVQAIGRDITNRKEAEKSLRESQELLQSIINNADAGIVIRTIDGQNLLANQRLSQMMGVSLDTIDSATSYQQITEEEAKIARELDKLVIETKRAVQQELTLTFPIGTRSILSSRFPILDSEDNIQSIGVITTDITERKAAEQKIQQLNSELAKANADLERRVAERTEEVELRRAVAEGVRYVLAFLNSDHTMEQVLGYIVTQACRLLEADACVIYDYLPEEERLILLASEGLAEIDIPKSAGIPFFQPKEEMYVAVSDLAQPESNPIFAERRKILYKQGYHSLLSLSIVIKDDFFGYLAFYYKETKSFQNEEIQIAMTFSDHIALAVENARLRNHAEAAATEAERNRIAQDLHDSVNQTLFSANIVAEVLPKIWEMDIEEGKKSLEELRKSTRSAVADMRTLLLELRPKALIVTPLVELLELLRRAATGRIQIPITLQTEGDYEPPAEVKMVFYRVAQEALNNIAKHANATYATLYLQVFPQKAQIVIQDDGDGFDMNNTALGHMGLNIMRERAQSVGATFVIASELGQGTTISLIWQAASEEDIMI